MTATPTLPLTAVVTSIERVERPAAWSFLQDREVFPARAGWDARVDIAEHGKVVATLRLDRIDGETEWHTSAQFRAGCSMPTFMHGLFSRCTLPQVAGESLAAVLDAAVAERAR